MDFFGQNILLYTVFASHFATNVRCGIRVRWKVLGIGELVGLEAILGM